jgi:hypothetical protein
MRDEVNSLKYQIHPSIIKRLNSCLTENILHFYAKQSVKAARGKLSAVRFMRKTQIYYAVK